MIIRSVLSPRSKICMWYIYILRTVCCVTVFHGLYCVFSSDCMLRPSVQMIVHNTCASFLVLYFCVCLFSSDCMLSPCFPIILRSAPVFQGLYVCVSVTVC